MKNSRNTRAIDSGRVCYECALPILDKKIAICPRCQCPDIDGRRARPKKTEPRKAPILEFPWINIRFELGGTALLSGDKGSGKTTLCMALRPDKYITSEQEPEKVGQLHYRINEDMGEDSCPLLSNCTSWEELDEDLIDLYEDTLIVVDSITQLASSHRVEAIVKRCIERVQKAGARAIFIAQFTKDADMAGPNVLNHLVDIVAKIPNDPMGMRRLTTEKNRFGALSTAYFNLGAKGVEYPRFRFAYSIEGPIGQPRLHPYPMKSGQYAGLLKTLDEAGIRPLFKMASAAIPCNAYMNGFYEPEDVKTRERFAENHGLTWISPQRAIEWLSDTETANEELARLWKENQ